MLNDRFWREELPEHMGGDDDDNDDDDAIITEEDLAEVEVEVEIMDVD